MYLRANYRRRGKRKDGPYYELCHAYQKTDAMGNKHKSHHYIAYLGKFSDRATADRATRERGLLCGTLGCGSAPEKDVVLPGEDRAKLCRDCADQWRHPRHDQVLCRDMIVALSPGPNGPGVAAALATPQNKSTL